MWRSEGLPRNSDQQGRVCLLRTQHYSAPFCSRVPSTCHRGAACTRPVTGGHHALRGRTALPGDTADSTATPWALDPKASFCIALQLERVLWDGPHAPDFNVPRLRLEMLPHHQKHQEDQGHVSGSTRSHPHAGTAIEAVLSVRDSSSQHGHCTFRCHQDTHPFLISDQGSPLMNVI